MKVVRPVPINDGTFSNSSIPEPDASQGEAVWIQDRFSGLVLTNKTYPTQGFTHGVKVGDVVYALETLEVNIGSNGVMHKYDSSGAHIGSFSVDGTIKSFGVAEDLNRLVGVDPVGGDVHEYNLSAESYIRTVSISGDVSTPQGITYGDGSYLVLDPVEKKIAKFDSNFNFQSRETTLDDTTDSLWSLHFLPGGFCSYVNRLTAELKAVRIGTSDIQWTIPVNVAAGTDFYIFGHYFSEGDPFVINFNADRAYRYKDGVYDGFYKAEERAIKIQTHKIYQCAIPTSDDPEDGVKKVPPTWVEVGATNRWAMFDYKRTTQSIGNASLDLELNFDSLIDAVSIFNFDNVDTIQIIATSQSSGQVYNKLHNTDGLTELVDLDIPPFNDLVIEIKFLGVDIAVGEVVVGLSRDLGTLVSGVVSDRIDYSRLKYDDFGEVEYVERPIVKYVTYPIAVAKREAPGIERYLDNLKGTQAVWVGDTGDDDLMITFGRIERSPMTYNNRSIVEYQIKVRGSI